MTVYLFLSSHLQSLTIRMWSTRNLPVITNSRSLFLTEKETGLSNALNMNSNAQVILNIPKTFLQFSAYLYTGLLDLRKHCSIRNLAVNTQYVKTLVWGKHAQSIVTRDEKPHYMILLSIRGCSDLWWTQKSENKSLIGHRANRKHCCIMEISIK